MWTHRTVEALAAHLANEMGLSTLRKPDGTPEDDANASAETLAGISEQEATAKLTATLDALEL